MNKRWGKVALAYGSTISLSENQRDDILEEKVSTFYLRNKSHHHMTSITTETGQTE